MIDDIHPKLSEAPFGSAVTNDSNSETFVKAKRKLTDEQLENLKFAREKAREKKLELGQLRTREKALKDKLLSDRITALGRAEAHHKSTSKKKKEKKQLESSSCSSSSSSDSSDCDEDHGKMVKPEKRALASRVKPVKAIKSVKDDALAAAMVRDELQKRMMKQTYQHAFASLFPGKPNIYV